MDTIVISQYKRGDIFDPKCQSRETLNLLSSKWTILIAYALQSGTLRNAELRSTLPGITQKVLTTTLRRMEQNGLVSREIKPVIPPWVEYSLTSLGVSLLPVLDALTEWSELHYQEVLDAQVLAPSNLI